MKLVEKLLPPGYRFRELWLPQNTIPNSSLLYSADGGHPLTLTGALLSSTVNGLEMRGAELITITDHADIHITNNLTVVLPAFILSSTFSAASAADMGLMNLNNGAVIARLNSTTGALDFIFNDVDGGVDETVSTTKVSWAAGTLWQVAFTFVNNGTGVISVRLYINSVAENTNDQVDGLIVVPVGNTTLGTDGVTFFTGKFQRMFLVYDTAILTLTQLLRIYKGEVYLTNLKAYLPFDHPGRGLTMPDRSVGGNCSGAISGTNTAAIWDFGAVKQPALGLDGVNDYGQSSSGVSIVRDCSLVLVCKMGSTYDALAGYHRFITCRMDGENYITIMYASDTDTIGFFAEATEGTQEGLPYAGKPSIGGYWIMLLTLTSGGVIEAFINGTSIGTDTGVGAISAGAATVYVGTTSATPDFDMNKTLLIALIEGALSTQEAKEVTRNINNLSGLGLSI